MCVGVSACLSCAQGHECVLCAVSFDACVSVHLGICQFEYKCLCVCVGLLVHTWVSSWCVCVCECVCVCVLCPGDGRWSHNEAEGVSCGWEARLGLGGLSFTLR